MQFTINPPGFENPSIREELSLNEFIQLSFVKCFFLLGGYRSLNGQKGHFIS